MKTLTVILLVAIFFAGCKEDDPCANTICLNDGVCIDGTCQCQNGYTGINCATPPNPCANVTCLNNGFCVDGTCQCQNGYTGINCEIPPPCIINNYGTICFKNVGAQPVEILINGNFQFTADPGETECNTELQGGLEYYYWTTDNISAFQNGYVTPIQCTTITVTLDL